VAADDAGRVQRLSYEALLSRVRNFSAGLASIGVKRGDRVALWMTNRLEWVISCFASVRLGAAVVPINTFLRPNEVGYCLGQSGARHLILLDRFRSLNMPQMLAQLSLPDLQNRVLYARAGERQDGFHDWDELEAVGGTGTRHWLEFAEEMAELATPDDLIMVKYTSGSTGFPKGVMLQQGGFVANGILHSQRTGMSRDDVYFSMMPFFHAGGSIYGLMSMLLQGGRLVFTEAFSVDQAITLLQQERATIFVSVLGKEVVMEANSRGLCFPDVWLAHVHNDAARQVLPNARFAFTPYGLTETYGPASITSPLDPPDKSTNTCGRPLPGNDIRAVDPDTGRDVAPGQVGEAWLRGNVMVGYWDKPEETAQALDKDGWVHSGDLITIDADGFVTYRGRLKLMAKVGGENVSLEEIERVITGHEAITHCGAIAVNDERKLEAVRVYVVRRSDMTLADDELRAWLRPLLAHFKMPRDIVFVPELPRLGSGKIDRITLNRWVHQGPENIIGHS
jgi:fatty-acyl-CoA synthase